MTDDSVNVDDDQDISAQKATETHPQRLHATQADQAVLPRSQEEREGPILAAPPEAWPEGCGQGAASYSALRRCTGGARLISRALVDLERS